MLKYSCNNFCISLICNNIYLNAATNNRNTKERLKIRLIIFNSKIIVPFFFSSVHRSIIQILGFIAKIRTEFQSRSCLFVINTYYRYVHFSWKRWMGFPFRLVLSISHLDHFRGISSRPSSPSISPLLVNEKVVDHFFEIKKRRGGRKKREEKKREAENR